MGYCTGCVDILPLSLISSDYRSYRPQNGPNRGAPQISKTTGGWRPASDVNMLFSSGHSVTKGLHCRIHLPRPSVPRAVRPTPMPLQQTDGWIQRAFYVSGQCEPHNKYISAYFSKLRILMSLKWLIKCLIWCLPFLKPMFTPVYSYYEVNAPTSYQHGIHNYLIVFFHRVLLLPTRSVN